MYLSINVTHERLVFTSFRTLDIDSYIEHREYPSQEFQKYQFAIRRMVSIIEDMSKDGLLEGIGISVAGYIDPVIGQVLSSYSFRAWDGKNLRDELVRFNCPIRIENDAVVTVLGQYRHSRDDGKRMGCVYFAHDAGLGAAVINPVDNNLLVYPVELGHTIVVPDGRSCACGQKGCLEQYIAGRGILDTYGLATDEVHDEEILVTAARYLTQGIMTLLIFYPLDVLYLAGQNMKLQHSFLESMVQYTGEMLERKFIFARPIIMAANIHDNVIDSGNLAQLAYGDRVIDVRYAR